jgi:hypothetical protein
MAYGQSGSAAGSAQGIVSDSSGAVLPGVTVTATSDNELGARTAITNEKGEYRFPRLNPGDYKLTFELQGFGTLVREKIDVHTNAIQTIDVQLKLANIEESVTVTAESPLVDSVQTQFTKAYRADVIENITGSRDIWTIVAQAPGSRINSFDIGGSNAGTQNSTFTAYGRSNHFRVEMDGVNTALSGVSNIAGQYSDFGAAEEVQMVTAGADATMAGPGMLIQVVGKKGGNRFTGREVFFFQNTGMQAHNVTPQLKLQGFGEGTRVARYADANFDVGGPIRRDKFWFYTSARIFSVDKETPLWPVNAPSTGPNNGVDLRNVTYNLTYQIDTNNRLQHSYQLGTKLADFLSTASNEYLDAVLRGEQPSGVGRVEWNHIVNNKMFFDVRLGKFDERDKRFPYGADFTTDGVPDFRRTEQAPGRSTPTKGGGLRETLSQHRWTFDVRGTKYVDDFAGGNHQVTLGYLMEHTTEPDELFGYRDNVQLQYRSVGLPDFTVPYRVVINNQPIESTARLLQQGAFAQDRFEVSKDLTLNLGVRWDFYSSGYPESDLSRSPYAGFFYQGEPLPNGYAFPVSPYPDLKGPGKRSAIPVWTSVFPRLGLSWAIGSRGTQAIKASWGAYKSSPGLGPARGTSPMVPLSATFNWNDLNGDRLFQQNEFGSFVTNSGAPDNSIDGFEGVFYSTETNLWYERQLGSAWSARVGFVKKVIMGTWSVLSISRPMSLYTFYPNAGFDPGIDGLPGTADDGGTIGYWDIPPGAVYPRNVGQYTDLPDDRYNYPTLDLSLARRLSKRWSMDVSASRTWRSFCRNNCVVTDPNELIYNDLTDRQWTFKAFATILAPWAVTLSPQVIAQSGASVQRMVQVTPRYQTSLNVPVEPADGSRLAPNPIYMNLQVRKEVAFSGQRLTFIVEGQNLFNSNVATSVTNITGISTGALLPDGTRYTYPRFLSPTGILPPRAARLGVQFNWGQR